MISLTGCRGARPDDARVMSYTQWLRLQVETLEAEIARHPVFDSAVPATSSELAELRSKSVILTYLKQQLLRRETVNVVADPFAADSFAAIDADTQEFVILRDGAVQL